MISKPTHSVIVSPTDIYLILRALLKPTWYVIHIPTEILTNPSSVLLVLTNILCPNKSWKLVFTFRQLAVRLLLVVSAIGWDNH